MTVMFHASTQEPWNALRAALHEAGFEPADISMLDKRQSSFKQVQSVDAVEGDLLIDVRRETARSIAPATAVSVSLDGWLRDALATRSSAIDTRAARRLFSAYVINCIEGGRALDVSAADFYDAVRAT
jgi:hypothetical protein